MEQHKRKRIWVDRFQTYLLIRIAIYCILFQAAIWSLAMVDRSVSGLLERSFGPESAAVSYVICFAGVILLTAAAMFDAMRLAHRLVGPLKRFRKTFQAVAMGHQVELVRLRDGDFLEDVRDDVNAMLLFLERRGAITLKPTDARKEEPLPEPTAV